ncbi:MAG: right-handed parallel beta-helix repeat-containing protein [Geobacter sp.]|nr:right-handed parallel beta-helix repeat-containing protein [Geobacter sp.]
MKKAASVSESVPVAVAGRRASTAAGWLAGLLCLLLVICCGVVPAPAAVLTADTVWSGTVTLNEDLLVPSGITLTILPGTDVRVVAAESTKTDPEYLSPLTEITVRGVLKAEGSSAAPIRIGGVTSGTPGAWAGIMIDGGSARFGHCRIEDAEAALHLLAGQAELDRSTLTGNRYGLVAQGKESRVRLTGSSIRENDYGISLFDGARLDEKGGQVAANRKRDRRTWDDPLTDVSPNPPAPTNLPVARVYRDEVLLGETVWQGRIEVAGQVRVPETARLVILPGTIVEFRRRDTNADGIGENGLLIQGVLVAKGMPDRQILFRSAEPQPTMADWDAINIMNSDGIRNLIEYCRIENAYRGLHFHFSNVLVNRSLFSNNYRGIQFQESRVDLRNNRFSGNKSAVQGRDSEVSFTGNRVVANLRGVNFFRADAVVRDNRFSHNALDGLRLRDSSAVVEQNTFDGNRYGFMAQDALYGRYADNVVVRNAEIGFSLKNLDNLEISGNFVVANGINGMSLQDVRALVSGNSFTGNGERGLGIISFDGAITGNSFSGNGLYAIDLEGSRDVSAPANWWGGELPETAICDRLDVPGRGKVVADSPSPGPLPFVWPLSEVPVSLPWQGTVAVKGQVAVPAGFTLTVTPGSTVRFSADAGLSIKGKLLATGEKTRRITFRADGAPQPAAWGEILLEHATGSRLEYCDITSASWGLHSHFTNLVVKNCRFSGNYGGMRFRSGPVEVSRSLFRDNVIGIRSYRGNARITENVITGNETGIFVREKGSGLEIRRNSLAGNNGVAIRVGDFNDEDVRAPENWWGVDEPGSMIFDANQESGIGFVRFEPVLNGPLQTGPEE